MSYSLCMSYQNTWKWVAGRDQEGKGLPAERGNHCSKLLRVMRASEVKEWTEGVAAMPGDAVPGGLNLYTSNVHYCL